MTQKVSLSTALQNSRLATFSPLRTLEASGCVRSLASKFSQLLEQDVTPRQCLHILNMCAASTALLLPAQAPMPYYALSLLWAGLALRGCARAFNEKQTK